MRNYTSRITRKLTEGNNKGLSRSYQGHRTLNKSKMLRQSTNRVTRSYILIQDFIKPTQIIDFSIGNLKKIMFSFLL